MKNKQLITKFIMIFISQIILMLFLLFTNNIVYATNDDTTMVSLAGGGYITPSEYLANIHILLGIILKELFLLAPSINWVTVLYLMSYLLSIFVLDIFLVIKTNKYPSLFLGYSIIFDICFILMICYFTFTVAAYSVSIAGVMCFIYGLSSKNSGIHKSTIYGGLLLLFSVMLRTDVLLTIFVMMGLLCIYEFVKNKKIRFITLEFIILMIYIGGVQSNLAISNLNPTQAAAIEWGELRSKALDCAIVPYNEESFSKRDMSFADYSALYNAFYYIGDTVSEKNLETLVELNSPNNKYNFDIVAFFKTHFSYITAFFNYHNLHKWMFYILFIFNLLFGHKKCRTQSVFVYLSTIALEFIYFFIQRNPYRIEMPTYVLAIMLLIFYGNYDKKIFHKIWNKGINYKKIYILSCTVLALIFTILLKNNLSSYNACYSDERKKVLNYLENNEDKLFLAGDTAVFSLGVAYSILENPGYRHKWNLIGNWEMYSVPSNNLIHSYGYKNHKNIAYDAVNNESILILTSRDDIFIQWGSYILDLYEQHYGIRPEYKKVTDITSNFVINEEYEYWAVYKLVLPKGVK